MDDAGFEHDVVHTNHSGAIIALETKVGTGSSTAVANSVLAGTGAGTSAWTTGTLANSISGNAATATALETARTIGGVSFNGTANINLPGVNTAGNQDTSGNAATATLAADSSLLGGLGLSAGSSPPSGSQVIKSHTNGYTYLGWINTVSGSTTSTVTRIYASNDQFVRYVTPATFRSQVTDPHYLPLSGGTMTGELQLNARLDVGNGTSGDHEIRIYKADNNVSDHIQFYNGTTRVGEIGCEDTTWLRINQETAKNIYTPRMIRADGGYQAKDGTNAAPAYTFFNDTNTGMYRVTTDQLGFATAGALRGRFWSQGLLMGAASTGNAQLGTGTGSPGAPVYHFYNDTNTGMYREETDMLGLSAGGEVVGLFRESTNNNTGSVGDGYVAFSTYMGGSTGTSAVIATTTISGQAVKRLMFNASGDEAKDTPVPWEMSDESYKKIAVSSFHYNDMYVDDDGMHHHWDKASALKGEQEDEPPETWVPLKRHGFMWSQIMEHEDLWPLATDLGISDPAVAAATVSVVQRLIDRVAALEAA
jgi:hypothetical protein